MRSVDGVSHLARRRFISFEPSHYFSFFSAAARYYVSVSFFLSSGELSLGSSSHRYYWSTGSSARLSRETSTRTPSQEERHQQRHNNHHQPTTEQDQPSTETRSTYIRQTGLRRESIIESSATDKLVVVLSVASFTLPS